MSVRAATAAAIGILALAVAGCGQPATPGPGHAAPGQRAVLTASVVLDAGGHAFEPTTAGAVLVTANAGKTWDSVRLPGTAALGHSVEVAGRTIVAVTVTSHGLAYQRSVNGGASWRTIAVPASTPTNQASVALSADGRQIAVMAVLPGSAGAGDQPELSVGGVAGPLTAVNAPVSGDVAWAGSTLVLTGGPLQSRLYTSADHGVTWTQQPVTGTLAPRFNVSPGTPSFGAPLTAGDTVTVPVTEHRGGGAFVRLYRSTGGSSYVPGARVALTGSIGAGVTALVSQAGPGRYVIASPGSARLDVVTATANTAIAGAGLTGTIDSLTFSDALNGLAQTTQDACSGKDNCRSTTTLYRTSDGGLRWEPVG
ncbi:MAG TPA: hypothetical protein VGH27_23395 [Streptosporangiaceae bacterium]|jgi:hypothetical protein